MVCLVRRSSTIVWCGVYCKDPVPWYGVSSLGDLVPLCGVSSLGDPVPLWGISSL